MVLVHCTSPQLVLYVCEVSSSKLLYFWRYTPDRNPKEKLTKGNNSKITEDRVLVFVNCTSS